MTKPKHVLIALAAIVILGGSAAFIVWQISRGRNPAPRDPAFSRGKIEAIEPNPSGDGLMAVIYNAQESRYYVLLIPPTTPIYFRNWNKATELRRGQHVTFWVSYFTTRPGPPMTTEAGARFIIIEPDEVAQ